MDKLEAMRVYSHVVETRSFARAAEALGLPRSSVSRTVKDLETWLGVQLLQRTTRKLSVTADGQSYYVESKKILREISALESSFPGRSGQPSGRFKVGMPQSLARHCILPGIAEFIQRYPELELILCSSDRVVDLIQEGFDCVIRTGTIEDSTTLVARQIARFRWSVLASPQYISQYGRPMALEDLQKHHAVGYLTHKTGRTTEWLFGDEGKEITVRMKEILIVDDTDAYIQAGLQGLGLIRVASYLVSAYLETGQLVACLENHAVEMPLSLVYPQSRHTSPAVRAFYDWSKTTLEMPNRLVSHFLIFT